jgi:hypothetical protein
MSWARRKPASLALDPTSASVQAFTIVQKSLAKLWFPGGTLR